MSGDLFDLYGRRKYLSEVERLAFLGALKDVDAEVSTLCHVLHYTGCRISEALALHPCSVDLADGRIIFETLKQRRRGRYRAVPVPDDVMALLDAVHGVRHRQRVGQGKDHAPLWPYSRVTAWRHVKSVMRAADIAGPQASPKGLRHGFGVAAISAGVPLNLVQRWLGHAQLSTTAIYANALGAEERRIAARMWHKE